jgi:hypothetical protein
MADIHFIIKDNKVVRKMSSPNEKLDKDEKILSINGIAHPNIQEKDIAIKDGVLHDKRSLFTSSDKENLEMAKKMNSPLMERKIRK